MHGLLAVLTLAILIACGGGAEPSPILSILIPPL